MKLPQNPQALQQKNNHFQSSCLFYEMLSDSSLQIVMITNSLRVLEAGRAAWSSLQLRKAVYWMDTSFKDKNS